MEVIPESRTLRRFHLLHAQQIVISRMFGFSPMTRALLHRLPAVRFNSAATATAAIVARCRARTVPNSHHVLIILSSRNVSGVLDSPESATDAEINTLEKRNVREKCYHLYRLATALQVTGTARCLAYPEPRSRYHHCLGRRSDLEDMGLAGGGGV